MSDPVQNVEIEDVLSSIRRLVSAEERDGNAGEDTPEARRAKDSRLVLTPAQRVDEPDSGVSAPEDAAAQGEASADAIAEGEAPEIAAAEAEAAEPEFDVSESSASEDPFEAIESAQIVQAREEEAAPEPEIAGEYIAEFVRHRPAGALHRAEDTAADDQDDDAFDMPRTVDDGVDGRAEDDAGQTGDAVDGGGGDVSCDMADDEPAEVDLKALEARIAGFESAVAEQDDDWEPDGASDDDYAGGRMSPLPWKDVEDDGKAEAEGRPPEPEAAEPSQDDEDEPGGAWYADDAVLDEEALRDMVSEIVRQELQGALGERITRNVRKLVRREIHRALMSQGID